VNYPFNSEKLIKTGMSRLLFKLIWKLQGCVLKQDWN